MVNAFQLDVPTSNKRKKLILMAPSPEDKKEWVAALEEAIPAAQGMLRKRTDRMPPKPIFEEKREPIGRNLSVEDVSTCTDR